MSRSTIGLVAAGLAVSVASLAAASATSASAAPTPSPTISWPAPGAGAKSQPPISIGGASLTARPLPSPLVLLDENVEMGTTRSFTLGADVLFDTGEDTLTPAADAALSALAAKITDEGITGKAAVVGNTDDVGAPDSNLSLSKRRAAAVTTRLTSLLSGRSITLTAEGKGETDPLVPNSSDANRARNRRVSVIFSGTKREVDTTDLSVPSTQPAPAADTSQAPEGSLAGTERTLTIDGTTWRVRFDVTGVRPVGSAMISVDSETTVLSGPPGKSFTDYGGLFSGSTYDTHAHATAIYDQSAKQLLPVVIDGKGTKLESQHNAFIQVDETADDWQLYPRPKDMSSGSIQLYMPGLGVLTVPVTS